MGITSAVDEQALDQLLNQNKSDLKVLYFYVEDSAECNQMTDVINELNSNEENKTVIFIKVDATKAKGISKKYEVQNAPTFLFHVNDSIVDKLIGANVPVLIKKVNENRGKTEEDLNSRLQQLIKKAPVMLFMKGDPSIPRCGFSKQVIALLDSHNAKYETFDILQDWDVREGLKKFSNWPTYPQLYINGELIGGLDILKELSSNGELDELLKSAS